MKKELLLTNQEKWILVKKLLIEGKTFKEIQRTGHVAPNFITKVKKIEFGESFVDSEYKNLKKKKLSPKTQAINLFYNGKTSKQVLIELDIDVNEVKKAQADYLQLLQLENLAQIVQDNRNNNNTHLLKDFCNLFTIFKELKIDTIEKVQEIKDLVETYPNLQYEISCLKKEIYRLKGQKKDLGIILNDINNEISLGSDINGELENQIKNKKIILENLEILEKKKSSSVYNYNIRKIIESTVKDEYWYRTTVLPLIIVSVFEVIRNDPMGKYMLSEFYYNNPLPLYKTSTNKENNIEEIIYNMCYRYLPIIMDINKYSQLLHENLLQIYSFYLFKIIKVSPLKNLENNSC